MQLGFSMVYAQLRWRGFNEKCQRYKTRITILKINADMIFLYYNTIKIYYSLCLVMATTISRKMPEI